MIKKVLIANRGEIALRVIRTCKALGLKTVAVYSDEDFNSLHVKQAEAYHIGKAAPRESYLNQEKILDAILKSGADAVHPGYGFLSENSDFAQLCEDNKINFIGPSAASMHLCGDKMRCKAAMFNAKVPTVPGSPDLVKDVNAALDIANEIGYPVLLKSVYGGGGRGIRLVHSDKELKEAYETVTGESIAAFGKSAILVEKFLNGRGDVENRIKEGKNTLRWDKTSCQRFEANQTRLKMGVLASNLLHSIRQFYVWGEELRRSIDWLIKRLIKVGARVSYHARRWYVHVALAFPLSHHYRAVLAWGS